MLIYSPTQWESGENQQELIEELTDSNAMSCWTLSYSFVEKGSWKKSPTYGITYDKDQ